MPDIHYFTPQTNHVRYLAVIYEYDAGLEYGFAAGIDMEGDGSFCSYNINKDLCVYVVINQLSNENCSYMQHCVTPTRINPSNQYTSNIWQVNASPID